MNLKGGILSINLNVSSVPLVVSESTKIQKTSKPKFSLKLDLSEKIAEVTSQVALKREPSAFLPSINRLVSDCFSNPLAQIWLDRCFEVLHLDFTESSSLQVLNKLGCPQGSNNPYILYDKGLPIAIIKPLNEEGGGFSLLIKNGIESGTMGLREVLAYKLFPEIVPPTALVELSSLKFSKETTTVCSIQQYVLGAKNFSALEGRIPIFLKEKLYPVISLDLVLSNSDRHRANLLFSGLTQDTPQVIPIDHGCILSTNAISNARFCWLDNLDHFDKLPFDECQKIRAIDFHKSAIEIQKLLGKACYINAFAIHLLTAQKFCDKLSIRHLAMYQIQRSEDLFSQTPLAHQLLKLAAIDASISFKYTLDDSIEIPLSSIDRVTEDVFEFIEGEKGLLEIFLKDYDLTDQEKINLLELDPKDLECTLPLDLTYEKTAEILDILLLNNCIKDLKEGSWKAIVHKALFDEMTSRVQYYHQLRLNRSFSHQ